MYARTYPHPYTFEAKHLENENLMSLDPNVNTPSLLM